MYFIRDEIKKVVFGWSAKCGCSHIKMIYKYLTKCYEKNKLFELYEIFI